MGVYRDCSDKLHVLDVRSPPYNEGCHCGFQPLVMRQRRIDEELASTASPGNHGTDRRDAGSFREFRRAPSYLFSDSSGTALRETLDTRLTRSRPVSLRPNPSSSRGY
jgi:hypothetical protein